MERSPGEASCGPHQQTPLPGSNVTATSHLRISEHMASLVRRVMEQDGPDTSQVLFSGIDPTQSAKLLLSPNTYSFIANCQSGDEQFSNTHHSSVVPQDSRLMVETVDPSSPASTQQQNLHTISTNIPAFVEFMGRENQGNHHDLNSFATINQQSLLETSQSEDCSSSSNDNSRLVASETDTSSLVDTTLSVRRGPLPPRACNKPHPTGKGFLNFSPGGRQCQNFTEYSLSDMESGEILSDGDEMGFEDYPYDTTGVNEFNPNELWCEDCNKSYPMDCPIHGKLQQVTNRPVLSKARASLPPNLQILQDYGVYTRRSIPKRTVFGPLEGKQVIDEADLGEVMMKFKLKLSTGETVHLDTSDESNTNWMAFIRPATDHMVQNLVAYQYGDSIYFATIKCVSPKQELRVWYAAAYSKFMGVKTYNITDEEKLVLKQNEEVWPCFECDKKFCSSETLQKHLEKHEKDYSFGVDADAPPHRGRPRPVPAVKKRQLCKICLKSFPSLYALKRHQMLHNSKWKCQTCGATFSKSADRAKHMQTHKEKPDAPQHPPAAALGPSTSEPSAGHEWECTNCALTFSNPTLLNLHILTHAAEGLNFSDSDDGQLNGGGGVAREIVVYKCSDCKKEFNTLIDIEDHSCDYIPHVGVTTTTELNDLATLNKDGGHIQCHVCRKQLSSRQALRYHTIRHSLFTDGIKPYRCPECQEVFVLKKDLFTHITSHGKPRGCRTTQNKNDYRCEQCRKSFKGPEKLERHLNLHLRNSTEDPIQCTVCMKRFLNNSAIACHMKTHSNQPHYKCPFCGKGFDRTDRLKEHVVVHAVNGVYACPSCQKTFTQYSIVRKHIRAFHSDRVYLCHLCEKSFPRPDKLKLHMLRHSDRRDFLCQLCGKQFKRKDKLKEHMSRLHNPEREAEMLLRQASKKSFKPKFQPSDLQHFLFKCYECNIGFKRRGMLVNHLAKRHPNVRTDMVPELSLPVERPNRNYYCTYCNKSYKSSSKRKQHILKHHPGLTLPPGMRKTKQNPVAVASDHPGINVTVDGKIAQTIYHCPYCHKQYSSKAKMVEHLRKKHPEFHALQTAFQVIGSIPVMSPPNGLTHQTQLHSFQQQQQGEQSDNQQFGDKSDGVAGSVKQTPTQSSSSLFTNSAQTAVIHTIQQIQLPAGFQLGTNTPTPIPLQTLVQSADSLNIATPDLLQQAINEISQNLSVLPDLASRDASQLQVLSQQQLNRAVNYIQQQQHHHQQQQQQQQQHEHDISTTAGQHSILPQTVSDSSNQHIPLITAQQLPIAIQALGQQFTLAPPQQGQTIGLQIPVTIATASLQIPATIIPSNAQLQQTLLSTSSHLHQQLSAADLELSTEQQLGLMPTSGMTDTRLPVTSCFVPTQQTTVDVSHLHDTTDFNSTQLQIAQPMTPDSSALTGQHVTRASEHDANIWLNFASQLQG